MRAYLNADQLAAATPWSVDAIEKMVVRGVLVRGKHYFQPLGRRTQKIFKWSEIVALIEGQGTDRAPGRERGILDAEAATAGLQELLSGYARREASSPVPMGGPSAVARDGTSGDT